MTASVHDANVPSRPWSIPGTPDGRGVPNDLVGKVKAGAIGDSLLHRVQLFRRSHMGRAKTLCEFELR